MVFSQVLLIVLLILLLFSVGESIINSAKLNMPFFIVSVLVMIVSSFIPPINIKSSTFYIAGFFVPLIISIYFLFKLESLYSLFRISISALLVAILLLLYNSLNLESINYMFLQPYIILAFVIGIASYFICKTFIASFISIFLGTTLTSLIYYSIQNISVGGSGFVFGNEQMLTIILVGTTLSLFSNFLTRKVRYLKKKRARKLALENGKRR